MGVAEPPHLTTSPPPGSKPQDPSNSPPLSSLQSPFPSHCFPLFRIKASAGPISLFKPTLSILPRHTPFSAPHLLLQQHWPSFTSWNQKYVVPPQDICMCCSYPLPGQPQSLLSWPAQEHFPNFQTKSVIQSHHS